MDSSVPEEALRDDQQAGFAAGPPASEHIFRAAPMTLVQMYIAKEVARDAAGALGSLGCVHFRDLNEGVSNFNRQYVSEVRKLEESMRLVRQLESYTDMPAEARSLNTDLLSEALLSVPDVLDICELLAEDADRLAGLVSSFQRLTRKRDDLLEERIILQKSQEFFGKYSKGGPSVPRRRHSDEEHLLAHAYTDETGFDIEENVATEFDVDDEDPIATMPVSDLDSQISNMTVLAGSIPRSKSVALERLCWRVTRGNLFFAKYPIEKSEKDVFLVYTHGSLTGERVNRIATSLDARIMVLKSEGRNKRISTINDQLADLFVVLDQTEGTLRLEQELVASRLPAWKSVVAKERAIFTTLNLFSSDQGRQGLVAEGWVPENQLMTLKNVLLELSSRTSQLLVVHTIHTTKVAPTHHTINKVTEAFQAMVDVYGTARNGEVNPGLPTVVTFPFMFAVMFGDMGHGFIMALAALAMVWNELKISRMRNRNEIFDMAFTGRYVLLLMGLFSMFTGFIYNDLFSKSMTIFASGWDWHEGNGSARRVDHHVYPIGLDWAWHGADNNLRFTNSYKMKLSILLGFAHMTYSLMFQYVNARHFGSWIDIWGNFVPGLIFMQSIFGYLSITILYKWCVDWIGERREPPGLLDMLIKMFLSPGTVDTPLYKGQAVIQCILVIVALLCVPWLLLFKPLYLRRQMKNKQIYMPMQLDEHTFAIDEDEGNELHIQDESPEHHEESFGDIMIHQVIHTIEFCLNCISHTASYLRLWALSLAHNQLSQVLWNMTIQNAFGPTGATGIFMVVALFAMWFVITVLVLVCMEGTSAMLHALRLHWVEAMSKHFQGEGHPFTPFDFTSLTE
nr:Vph1.1 [Starmerella bombicola]